MSKNNLRRITLNRGPIWGIHSLTLIISCIYCMYSTVLSSCNALHPTAPLLSLYNTWSYPATLASTAHCSTYFNDIYCMYSTVLTSCNALHPTPRKYVFWRHSNWSVVITISMSSFDPAFDRSTKVKVISRSLRTKNPWYVSVFCRFDLLDGFFTLKKIFRNE